MLIIGPSENTTLLKFNDIPFSQLHISSLFLRVTYYFLYFLLKRMLQSLQKISLPATFQAAMDRVLLNVAVA